MKRPVIGITCHYSQEHRDPEGTLLLSVSCVRAIQSAGGIPQPVPLSPESDMADLLNLYDGLLVSGGGGLPPHIANLDRLPDLYTQNPVRHSFERALVSAALSREMPLMGICRGHQTINDVLGGTLLNIDEHSAYNHRQSEPHHVATHAIAIERDSLLYQCCASSSAQVNSLHSQAVERPGEGLKATAYSPDGMIEAIEAEDYPFLLGVQFHPEYMMAERPEMAQVFQRFVQAAGEYRKR